MMNVKMEMLLREIVSDLGNNDHEDISFMIIANG
jgi:hypothetical protein